MNNINEPVCNEYCVVHGTSRSEQPAIDHNDQLQRMIDAYERPILNAMQEERYSHLTVGHVRQLVRQAIEQAWDAGHACARQNDL